MLSIELSALVEQIVRSELVNNHDRKEVLNTTGLTVTRREGEAMYLNFDARLSYHHDSVGSFRASRGLHLLYYNSPQYNYVSVFSAVTNNPFAVIAEVEEWKHESSHDSCWRDINVFSEVYFAMAEEINELLAKEGLEKVAPIEMSQFVSFGGLGRDTLYEMVPVRIEKADHYKRNIVLLNGEK